MANFGDPSYQPLPMSAASGVNPGIEALLRAMQGGGNVTHGDYLHGNPAAAGHGFQIGGANPQNRLMALLKLRMGLFGKRPPQQGMGGMMPPVGVFGGSHDMSPMFNSGMGGQFVNGAGNYSIR